MPNNQRCEELAFPLGCTPNWPCTIDRMLIKHTRQRQALRLIFVKKVPRRNSKPKKQKKKKRKCCLLTSYQACCCLYSVWMSKKEKEKAEVGDRPALMRLFSTAYLTWLVYCLYYVCGNKRINTHTQTHFHCHLLFSCQNFLSSIRTHQDFNLI